jgi:hypothetical protein
MNKKEESSKTRLILKELKQETKKQTATALLAAFGFLIALVWRDVIQEASKAIISYYSPGFSLSISLLYTALLTTFVAVIGIIIIHKWTGY